MAHAKDGRSDPVAATKAIGMWQRLLYLSRASAKEWMMDLPEAMSPDQFEVCPARSTERC